MNNYIFRKTLHFALTVGLLTAVSVLYMVWLIVGLLPQNEAQMRLETHALQNELERRLAAGQDIAPLPPSNLPYAVFDLRGRLLGSTMPQYKEDTDIRLLGRTVPLIAGGEQVGILTAEVPDSPRWGRVLLYAAPPLFVFAVTIILFIRHGRFVRGDILRPLEELHTVVDRMVGGDLSVPVSYDYEGEIGTFCHDFEKMRDELRDAGERERIHKEKERLLFASLSHDLKTPLSSISGYAEGIRYGVAKEREDIERYTDMILKKAKELTRSIEDILTHVQTQMHEMSIRKEELYSKPLFEKLFSEAADAAAAKGIVWNQTGEVPNRLISADPARIAQVVQNIAGNAVKYTAPGGCITVSAEADAGFIHVWIEDTGCGVKPEDLPFVFEPFFRGEKSRDPNVSGSGLGLSIARYIVEQHGGTITCESVLGEGTRISFSVLV